MIQEAYCSKEVSKLLKEKGFDELCKYLYKNNGERYTLASTCYQNICDDGECLCPTHQMAMAWLRENHNICIIIEPHQYDYINEKNASYICSLWQGDNYHEYIESKDFPSYEEAVEAALKYILENLI